jgi:capsular exopolysaccharide synthesis family protein
MGIAFLIEYLNDSIQTVEDIRQVQNMPTLGSITRIDGSDNELATMAQPRSPVAESFRVLANNIHKSSQDLNLRTILVTSPNPGEGKSLVAANLAAALAQRELGVVLVDADLRLPRQHELFSLELGAGLTGVSQNGRFKLQQIDPYLNVLTSGYSIDDPSKVITSKRIITLLDKLAENAELVLVDCPPILPVADATILASVVDSVVIVVRADQTRRSELQDAFEHINKVSKSILGVVLNGASSQSERYYQYYGGEYNTGRNRQRLGRKLGANLSNLFDRDGSKQKKKQNTDAEMQQEVHD